MTETINKICNWIRCHSNRDKINNFSIIVILLYYYVGLLFYITTPFTNFYYLLITPSIATSVRIFLTFLICLYSLLIIVINQYRLRWNWVMLFIYILLFTLLSTSISPQSYQYMYVTNLYGIVHKVVLSPGWLPTFTMFLSSISDFAIAYCLLFIFPIVINDKKQILFLLLPIVFICLFECGFSLIYEKEEYIKLFSMSESEYGGYSVSIGASFGNKQDWGSFATIGQLSSLFAFTIFNKKPRSFIWKAFLVFSSLVIYGFTIISLCKTAILSQTLLFLIFVIALFLYLFKKNKAAFYITVSFTCLILLAFLAFYFIDFIHNLPFLHKIYTLLNDYLFKKISWQTIYGRTSIWYSIVENLRTYNLFFGLSKSNVGIYSKTIIMDGQYSIHNGIFYFMLSYGILGFIVYILLTAIVLRNIFLIFARDRGIGFALIGTFTCTLIFMISEAEVFIVSGSNLVFVYNVILCSFAEGYRRRLYEKSV